MSKAVDHEKIGLLPRRAEFDCSVGDRAQRRLERAVQFFVAFVSETGRLHATAKQVKAEVEIPGFSA